MPLASPLFASLGRSEANSPLLAARLWNVFKPIIKIIAFGLRALVRLNGGRFFQSSADLFSGKVSELDGQEYLFRYVFPWAMEKAKAHYSHEMPNGVRS